MLLTGIRRESSCAREVAEGIWLKGSETLRLERVMRRQVLEPEHSSSHSRGLVSSAVDWAMPVITKPVRAKPFVI